MRWGAGTLEADAGGGQAVEIRGVDGWIAIGTDHWLVLGVGHDQAKVHVCFSHCQFERWLDWGAMLL